MAAPSSPSSSSSYGSGGGGGGSRRKSTSSRMLTAQEEDRLGKVVTSKQTFTSKIQHGRGSMVCLLLELKDVNGGENPGEPMDIEAHPLLSNGERASSDNERLKMTFKGTIVPEFRDFLYHHSTTLDADTPIRCMIGGHGARVSSRKVVVYDRDQLVVRLWPPALLKARQRPKRSSLASSQSSDHGGGGGGDGDGDDESQWFQRLRVEEPQATQLVDAPLAPNLSAPVENSQAVNALLEIGSHAFDAKPARQNAHEQHSQGGGEDDASSQQYVASQQEQEVEEQESAVQESAPQDFAEDEGHSTDAQEVVAQEPASQPASEPSSWPSDLVASPPPASSPQQSQLIPSNSTRQDSPRPDSGVAASQAAQPQDHGAADEASTNLATALQDGAQIIDGITTAEPLAASPPAASPPETPAAAGDEWFATPQQQQQGGSGSSGSPQHTEDSNAPDASELLAEAEATQYPSAVPSMPTPARARMPVASSSTPVTPLSHCVLDGPRYKFLAMIHTRKSPHRTEGPMRDLSLQVVLVDKSGYLKTMFFANKEEDFAELQVGATILVEPVNIQEWPGAKDPRQGRGDRNHWKAACMPPPSPDEPLDSGGMGGTLRPSEDEFAAMLALRNWYHFEGGSEDSIRRYPMAWLRPTKTIAEIRGKPTERAGNEKGGHEFFDMLAQVVEFYPPLGPSQPASVYVTDYTWHDGLRSIYEQHLGYEEDEYMPRAAKTKIGGGRVLQIALFDKQAQALFGLKRGQFILFTSLRSRWTADYGLSAAVGSDRDFSLRLREGSNDPGMPQLLARKREWEAKRAVELKQRQEAEEENEEAWREAHAQELEEARDLPAVKQEQRSVSAEARLEPAEEEQQQVREEGGEDGQPGHEDAGAHAGAANGNVAPGTESEPAHITATEDNARASPTDEAAADKTISNGRTSEAEDAVMVEGERDAQAAVEQSGDGGGGGGEDTAMAAGEDQEPQAAHDQQQQANGHAQRQATASPALETAAPHDQEQQPNGPAAVESAEQQKVAGPEVVADEEMPPIDDAPLADNALEPSKSARHARARVVMDVKAFEQVATSASYGSDAIQAMTAQDVAGLFPPDRPELHDYKVYAKLERARILDIKPRDPAQWIRAKKGKGNKEVMLALLLAEEGGDDGVIDPRRCLPVVLSGEMASSFFGLDGERLALDQGYEEEARAVVKAKLEGLVTLERIVEEESQTQEEVIDADGNVVVVNGSRDEARRLDEVPSHDWGLAIWVGKKSSKRQVSIFGCYAS